MDADERRTDRMRRGTAEPGGADEIEAAHDALVGRAARIDASAGEPDGLTDQSELDELRLQQAMERRSKLEQTIADMLEADSDAEDGIVDDLR
jgi:hypothetical protein